MAGKLSKKQKNLKKNKLLNQRTKKNEQQDSIGISRKKWKYVIDPKTFFTLKILTIIAIPISYFCYSPLLVLVMMFYVCLFFFAYACEHSLNKSVIKSNHIKLLKFDSAIALLLIIVSFFGAIFGVSSGRIGRFSNTLSMKIMTNLKNFGSLLTGQRTLWGRSHTFGFGIANRPDGFVPNKEAFQEILKNMPNYNGHMPHFGSGMPPFRMNMNNIPVEFMFSQLLSTINTVLIFTVAILGVLSLIYTIRKINRFNIETNEFIEDGDITILSDDEINKILSYGVEDKD